MGRGEEHLYHLLSYPPHNWGSEWAGKNFKSKEAIDKPRSPRKALSEWISLADAITAAGGAVLVMPPPTDRERKGVYLGSMTNMANAGELIIKEQNLFFLLSRMNPTEAPHRAHEWQFVKQFMKKLGIESGQSIFTWEGQADVLRVSGNMIVATYGTTSGVRSSSASMSTLWEYFSLETKIIPVELAYPFFHGDTALALYTSPQSGERIFLYCPTAIVGGEEGLLAAMEQSRMRIMAITKEAGCAYTANTLQVGQTLIMNREVPQAIREAFKKYGFLIAEVDLAELFGKAGGGPRCLTNILRFPAPQNFDPAICYPNCRKHIIDLLETYPA